MIIRLLAVIFFCFLAVVLYNYDKAAREVAVEKKTAVASVVRPQYRRLLIRDEIFGRYSADTPPDSVCYGILRKSDLKKIPHFALKKIPLTRLNSSKEKRFFMKVIASVAGKVNDIVEEHRKIVLSVAKKREKSIKLTRNEAELFDKICRFYQTKNISKLLLRVAPVPLSLAVAQAVLESRYGGDRTIRRLNAYFGLMKASDYLIKFDNLFNAAIAYVKTLNVNENYKEFREQRAIMIAKTGTADGLQLAPLLKNYGSDKKYVQLISELIRLYDLSVLDKRSGVDVSEKL
ncbi:MAG: glucosaminidase domain-containing protein [Holosporaceae bacterium]|jgi:uncharacterized FlgJ-related protein|nr:glucosaminidase domain-containing protein [Holosporaceae bacterium]